MELMLLCKQDKVKKVVKHFTATEDQCGCSLNNSLTTTTIDWIKRSSKEELYVNI